MESRHFTAEKLNEISTVILNSAIAVHREIGPGLLEAIYQQCLVKELRNRGLTVSMMVTVPLHYKGEDLNKDYVIDILVEDEIILELKLKEFSQCMRRKS